MLNLLRRLIRYLPTLLLAFIMALAVWFSAVTAADPNQQSNYPNAIPITLFGQDPGMILTSTPPKQVTVVLVAPQSIWHQIDLDNSAIRAIVDLSGLGPGTHTVKVQVIIGYKPVRLVSIDPETVTVTLEALATRTLPVTPEIIGVPATGFKLGLVSLSQSYITFSGPSSIVQQVSKILASINVDQANADINQAITLQAKDTNNNLVNGLTFNPTQVTISIPITQLGGYRNVAVKAMFNGQQSNDYRITNISVTPSVVTVFSSDPKLVDSLPGYIETMPIDLTGAHDDVVVQVQLNLPTGISVVGDQAVTVKVGIAAVEGSITLTNMPVTAINQGPNLAATVSPGSVDIILSGPLILLNSLTGNQVHITVDMTGKTPGTYQEIPEVTIDIPSIGVESILPGMVQVTVINATPTPYPTPLPSVTPIR
jgi:YbbR domain-containing protein